MSKLLRLAAVLGIIVTLLVIPLSAQAYLTDPSTLEVENVQVFRHMLEANDVLLMVLYNCAYDTYDDQPTYGIDSTFTFTYKNSSGDLLQTTTAYPYFNLGYVKGLVAFYWAEDDEDIPTWGDLGNVTVTGVASYFSPAPADTYTLQSSDYSTYSEPSEIREELRQWIVDQCTFLDYDWNNWGYTFQSWSTAQVELLTDITSGFQVLSAQGETYLTHVLITMDDICPSLFLLETGDTSIVPGNFTLSQETLISQQHDDDFIGDAQKGVGDLLGGIDRIWASTIIVIVGALALIIICQVGWKKANCGMLIAYALIVVATPEGLFQMGLMAFFAVLAVLQIADTWWWRRSSG